MKIHRFIQSFDLSGDKVMVDDPQLVHQMGKVLRLEIGELVILCDGKGSEVQGVILEMDKRKVIIGVQERRQNIVESKTSVRLYVGLLKRDAFELALQKATEVGVSEIIPIITQRTIKQRINLERLQVIVREAAEQSGRGIVPIVREAVSFEEGCKEVGAGEGIFLDIQAPLIERSSFASKEISLFIGPEGGWTDEERDMATRYGFVKVGLGPQVLRGETAVTVACYLFSH